MHFNEQMQSNQDNVETNHAKSSFAWCSWWPVFWCSVLGVPGVLGVLVSGVLGVLGSGCSGVLIGDTDLQAQV